MFEIQAAQPSARTTIGSVTFLGLRIARVRLTQLLDEAFGRAARRIPTTILYVNIHCMNVADRDPRHAEILNDADIVYCDGTGVRLAAQLVGIDIPARMTGADWIGDLCEMAAERRTSLFLLGGQPGTAQAAARILVSRYPDLQVVGAASGFDPGPETVRLINCARPDILLVGMGTPTQERWIDAHRGELQVPVVWAVGALFDFVTGRIPRGPRWMTEHGLEWVCRLAAEPRKLWRRYLVGNPAFAWRVFRRYVLSRGLE